MEDVRFDDPRNYIVAARVDESTGLPTHYAVKAYGDVISGKFDVQTVKIGAFEKFRKVVLGGNDIVEVMMQSKILGNSLQGDTLEKGKRQPSKKQ